ncbi:MAG TPA: winged helix-turn-helix domain-containing protein, partial [Isosphaeraceae bacterium]|nr:winged helix-turn-helix domain-containing protein [Isosphaeraceae bacterium]
MSKVIKKPQAVADLESAIVRLVRARGEVSRSEVARELGLVASTTGIYVERLISRGYLLESKGRTPSP